MILKVVIHLMLLLSSEQNLGRKLMRSMAIPDPLKAFLSKDVCVIMMQNPNKWEFTVKLEEKPFKEEKDYFDKNKITEFLGTTAKFDEGSKQFLETLEKTLKETKVEDCPGFIVTLHEGFFTMFYRSENSSN